MTTFAFAARVRGAPTDDADPTRVAVPGIALEHELAAGATTRVMHGLEDDGEEVAVLLLADTREARRRAQAALTVRHPHLLAARAVTTASDGSLAVITDACPTTLADVLTRRETDGPLTAGELAGLLDGLGHALGRWHEAVGPHGDVRAANVLVDASGRAVLADLLEDPALLEPHGTAQRDLTDLAALLLESAEGSDATAALTRALRPVLRPTGTASASSLDARGLAAGAAMLARPEPLAARRVPATSVARPPSRLERAEATPHRDPAAHRRRVLGGFTALGLVLGIAAGGVVAWQRGAEPGVLVAAARERLSPSTTLASAPGESPTGDAAAERAADRGGPGDGAFGDGAGPAARDDNDEPGAVGGTGALTRGAPSTPLGDAEVGVGVGALLAARDDAIRDGDPLALAELTVLGSPAAAEDAALLEALASVGEDVLTQHTTLDGAQTVAQEGEAVTVRATIRQEESTRRGPDGTRVIPAQPARCVLLDLVAGPAGMRLASTGSCDGH